MNKRIKILFRTFIAVGMVSILFVLTPHFLPFNKVSNNQQEYVSEKTPDNSPSITPASSPTPTLSPTVKPTLSPKPVLKPTPTPKTVSAVSLDDLFAKYGSQYGVDVGLLKKIAGCESGFDPSQVTGDYAGLFQFGSTPWVEARGRIGLSNDLSLRFNAEESMRTAAFEISHFCTSGWSDCD